MSTAWGGRLWPAGGEVKTGDGEASGAVAGTRRDAIKFGGSG